MGQVKLDEVEQLEIKNILLRQKLQAERIEHADTAKTLLLESAVLIANERELLMLRLITKYGLENLKSLQLAPDGTGITYEGERPQDIPRPPPKKFTKLPDGTVVPLGEDGEPVLPTPPNSTDIPGDVPVASSTTPAEDSGGEITVIPESPPPPKAAPELPPSPPRAPDLSGGMTMPPAVLRSLEAAPFRSPEQERFPPPPPRNPQD